VVYIISIFCKIGQAMKFSAILNIHKHRSNNDIENLTQNMQYQT